jgi:phage shock protein E
MDWTIAIAVFVALAAFLVFKRMSFISPNAARKHLAQGALVVDVRSPGEFQDGHLSKAVNIPLGELATAVPRHVPDKSQVLLLHCHGGGRSELARQRLKRLGYPNAYNLGSFARAREIVGE